MNTVWQIADQALHLHRFPKGQHDKSLQAWDSADQYAVEHTLSLLEQTPSASITVVNDLFGAISVALAKYRPKVVTDSYVSEQAIAQNSQDNNLDCPIILNSLTPWPNSDVVVLKLTKSIGYLEYQLQQIQQLTSPCQIIASGKTTLVTSNVLKLFERYLTNVSTSLAKKKSRLIFADHPGQGATTQTEQGKYPVKVAWPEQNMNIASHANVFGKDQIDIGGRFLVEHLPDIAAGQTVIDLGCGNGILGLSCLKQLQQKQRQAQIHFCDESFMAVESAKLNVIEHFPELVDACKFSQDDCLSQQAPESADVILCNPPFHQQNTITEHIAKQMFKQSYQCLKANGQLLVVANRHLPYPSVLKKLFGGFTVLAQNKKFIIYQCNKNN